MKEVFENIKALEENLRIVVFVDSEKKTALKTEIFQYQSTSPFSIGKENELAAVNSHNGNLLPNLRQLCLFRGDLVIACCYMELFDG